MSTFLGLGTQLARVLHNLACQFTRSSLWFTHKEPVNSRLSRNEPKVEPLDPLAPHACQVLEPLVNFSPAICQATLSSRARAPLPFLGGILPT